MRTSLLLLPLILACADKGAFVPTGDSGEEADTDTDSDTDTDTDTDSDTDEDGDGWTVEEGDCDDTDYQVNPAWEEDPDDEKDNDCDERVDEEWRGLAVAYSNDSGTSSIFTLDSIGRLDGEIELSDDCYPTWMDVGVAGSGQDGGYVINDGYDGVALVAADGTCSRVVDYSKDKDFPYVFDVKTHPDGYYLATRGGELLRIETDGSFEVLASWEYDYNDAEKFQFFAYALAIDWMTGEVALFDFLGGYATWSEADGMVIVKQADLSDKWANWDGLSFTAAAYLDGGGFYASGKDYLSEETVSIYRWNVEDQEYVQKIEWDLDYYEPDSMVMNGDVGDWYVTANAAQYYRVWKIREVDSTIDDLYISEQVHGRGFHGIVSLY
jgi:hypothetical protein